MTAVLTPKFLTRSVAMMAVGTVLEATLLKQPLSGAMNRKHCHIVILIPSMPDESATDFPNWPNYQVSPHVLYEEGIGGPPAWEYDYMNIARCKALQLWHDRNDGRTDFLPHLVFPHEAPLWGGVKREGIVVACSGVQPYFDRMISGMIADMCIGLAHHEWMMSKDRKDDVCFLSA